MAENINALILPIGADASQFKQSINNVKSAIKDLSNTISATPFNLVSDEQKLKLNALQETLKILSTDVKEFGKSVEIPKNSITGLNKKIAELNKQKIILDATTSSAQIEILTRRIENLTQLRNKIDGLGSSFKNLAKDIEFPANSIAGLDKRIRELNAKKITLDAKTSASEIARLTKEIEKLTEKRNNINALGSSFEQAANSTTTSSKRIQDSSKKARTALTSLSLVAQDLPFGFIAIQNNIPNLITAFDGLRAETKSTRKAFAELGAVLQGPVGALFALSAGISIVTYLTQKYGSLGNAIDAIIGKTVSLKSIQDKVNKSFDDTVKSTAGEVANLNSLVNILTNANSKKEQQLGAYDELNKKYPGFLFNIDRENIATATSAKLIAERTKLISQQIILEGRRNALIELIGQSAKEGEIALRGIVTQGKDLGFFEKVLLGIRGTFAGIGGAGVLNILSADLGNAAKESQFFKDKLDGVNNVLTETNNAVNILIKSQDELEKKQKAAAAAAEKAAKDAERQAKKATIGTITQGEALNNGVITSDIGLLTRVIEANVRLTNLAVDRIRRYRDKSFKDINGIKPLDLLPKKLDKRAGVPMSEELSRQVGGTLLELDNLSNKFQQTSQALESTFLQPLTSAFEEFFETGKIGFKEFGKSIIKTIQQIVAKIIATGIINLLASILVPGGAQAASLVGGAAGAANSTGLGRAFGDAFRSVLGLGGNRVAAPSFAGVGGGGMQMNGQVVFVQRGSDLVGVLNRTNGTINRVG